MLIIDANVWLAAFDPHDAFHGPSAAFLRTAARLRLPLNAPVFALVEIGCALSRRTRDATFARGALGRVRAYPLLALTPVDERLIATALEIGMRLALRGADALYAATAALTGATLISWDAELSAQAGAMTPDAWLRASPQA
ncbi:MAG: PIN domain-containing protein [Thermoflexales bacterium]